MMTREEGAKSLREIYQKEGRYAALVGIGVERCPYTTAAPPDRVWGVQAAVEWLHGWHAVDNGNCIIDAIMTDKEQVLIHGPPVSRDLQLVFGGFKDAPVTGVVALADGIHVAYEDGSEIVFAPKEPK